MIQFRQRLRRFAQLSSARVRQALGAAAATVIAAGAVAGRLVRRGEHSGLVRRARRLRPVAAPLSAAATAVSGALLVLVTVAMTFARDLPDSGELARYEPPVVSRVYAADGQLIGEFASEKRIFVPYAAIPQRVVQAFIAAEDQRFFSHAGIDPQGTLRALRSNVRGNGARLQGGSTITQQVAKNFFLTAERSVERKIKEALLAIRLERAFSKSKILELYLNQIFLGRQAYGVAAAAQVYFGKRLEELSVAEAAFLAGLAQAPSRYSPDSAARRAVVRRNYVIHRMAEDGFITAADAATAKAQPLGLARPAPAPSVGAEYFVEEVRRDLLARFGEARMRHGGFVVRTNIDLAMQAAADRALRAGLMAYDRRHGWRGPLVNLKTRDGEAWARDWRKRLAATPLPPGHGTWRAAVVLALDDKAAQIAFADGRRGTIPLAELRWARKQGTVHTEPGKPVFKTATGPLVRRPADVLAEGDVVLVEPAAADDKNRAPAPDTYALRQIPEVTGALVAMDPHTGRVKAMAGGFSFWMSQFNNATQAWRQPGSSFKPYVYLAAFEQGFTPATTVLDAPITLAAGNTVYTPKNFSGQFSGLMSLRGALERSLNVVTVRLADATGLDNVVDVALRLQVSDRIDPVLSMALGSFETTPLRQVTAYSVIANGGRRVTPSLIDRMQDRHGRTIFHTGAYRCAGCDNLRFDGTPPKIEDRREQIVDPDHAFLVVSLLQGVVQRGTGAALANLGFPVAGKTGTTNDVMDAWFVGFTPNLAVAVWIGFDQPRTLGPAEQGGSTAAPIVRDFLRAALKGQPAQAFQKPPGVVTVGAEYFKRGTEPGTGNGRTIDVAAPTDYLREVGMGSAVEY